MILHLSSYTWTLPTIKIEIHKREDLVGKNKKVVIWGRTIEIARLDFPLLYCIELVDVRLVDGETYPQGRGKFKIDDYE